MHSGSLDALLDNIVVDIKHDGVGVIDYATATLKSFAKDQTEAVIICVFRLDQSRRKAYLHSSWLKVHLSILAGCSNNFSYKAFVEADWIKGGKLWHPLPYTYMY